METEKFQDLLGKGKLTRRQAHRVLASVGVSTVLVRQGAQAACGGQDLTFFTWGGYDDPNFLSPYIEQYGCEPSYSLMAGEDEAFAKMRAGFEPHVIFPCSAFVKTWKEAGLIVPIDTGLLTNWPDVLPAAKNTPDSVIDGERYFVPEDWGQTSVLFRADLAPEYAAPENQSWGILFDEKYAGRLGTTSLWSDNVYPAAMYLGLDPYNLSDSDIVQLHDLLREQRKLIRVTADTTTDLNQAFFSGEVIASTAINSMWTTALDAMNEPGFEGEYIWMNPKEGTLNWVCGLVIHPAARRDGLWEKAHAMIDAMLSVDSQYYELTAWNYGVVNAKTYDLVDDAFLHSLGLQRDINGYLSDGLFMGHNDRQTDLINMWDEVTVGM